MLRGRAALALLQTAPSSPLAPIIFGVLILLVVGALCWRSWRSWHPHDPMRNMREELGGTQGFGIAGAVIGAMLGFLFRPSVPLIGQLPIETVLSRGSNLNGMDMLLRPAAEQSFNYLLVGTILGAAIVAGMRYMTLQNAARPTTVPASPAPTPPIAAAATAPGGNSFCTSCGTPLGDGITFCGRCGTKRG
jgi:uncharacterized membrane protein YfcA